MRQASYQPPVHPKPVTLIGIEEDGGEKRDSLGCRAAGLGSGGEEGGGDGRKRDGGRDGGGGDGGDDDVAVAGAADVHGETDCWLTEAGSGGVACGDIMLGEAETGDAKGETGQARPARKEHPIKQHKIVRILRVAT